MASNVCDFPQLTTGRMIEAVIRYRGLSIGEFADAINEHKMNVYKILNGRRPITQAMALRIGKALGMSPVVIMGSVSLELCGFIKNDKEK